MLLTALARKTRPIALFCAIALASVTSVQAQGSGHGKWNSGPKAVSTSHKPQSTHNALREASAKRAKGQRVWCVPFARTASGINLQGNAKTWWGKAEGVYGRGKKPIPGSVMTFQATGKLPMGHVAVVSKVVSPRKILIDHANWNRNQVSLGMAVVDISPDNSWSSVRVETVPGTLGRPYPVKGFIYPVKNLP